MRCRRRVWPGSSSSTTPVSAHVVAAELRSRGHRVRRSRTSAVDELTESHDGYVVDPARPEQFRALLDAHLAKEGDLAGIVDCWALDIPGTPAAADDETAQRVGVFAILHLVTALAELDTATAAPAPGDLERPTSAGHRNPRRRPVRRSGASDASSATRSSPSNWGADRRRRRRRPRSHRRPHLPTTSSTPTPRTRWRIRGEASLVPRLRPCAGLTRPFPTKLSRRRHLRRHRWFRGARPHRGRLPRRARRAAHRAAEPTGAAAASTVAGTRSRAPALPRPWRPFARSNGSAPK